MRAVIGRDSTRFVLVRYAAEEAALLVSVRDVASHITFAELY